MKLNFKFTNLFGTTYKSGNLEFAQNGSCILSPVGNNVTAFHLLRDESRTVSVNSHFNLTHVALSPRLPIMFTVNTNGEGSLVSLLTGNVINTYNFRHPISAVAFSPNGKYLAISKNHCIMVFLAPARERSANSLELYRFLYGFQDLIKNIDWSSDSRFIIAGSDDMTARVLSVTKCNRLIIYTLPGHRSPVFAKFYDDDTLNCITVGTDCVVKMWTCDTELKNMDSTSDIEPSKANFRISSKFIYQTAQDHRMQETITALSYHRKLKILVTAFESGLIMLHQLPEFILIDTAKFMVDPITAVAINPCGDWVAVGSEEHGQLAVWEWRSKSCHLRAESHANEMTSLAYSPDGLLLVTGGCDAKIKVWKVGSGRAVVTFSEHQAPVSQVLFPAAKPKVIVSASLDGTVRAFDLTRYRNFRTMSVPNRGVQFSCLGIDSFGDLVGSGALDSFDAYIWSLRTGQLLSVLTSHTAPVSSVLFNPGLEQYRALEVITGSWDGSVRTWSLADCDAAVTSGAGADAVVGSTLTETISLPLDVVCMAYRHDGRELAVAMINATILFFDPTEGTQLGSIEGRSDLDVAQVSKDDLVTPHKAARERKFLSITYSADGQHLLAGGDSKFLCLYSIPDRLLLKRFEITVNLSLEGVQESHDRRRYLAAYGADAAAAKEQGREALPLPGVRIGTDRSRRWWRPDVRVTSVQFSPTGDAFAATATEGVFVYALEKAGMGNSLIGGVSNWLFDALSADEEATPSNARLQLAEGNLAAALDVALRLQIHDLLEEVIEAVPHSQINFLTRNLPIALVIRCLIPFLARQLEGRSRHVAFYVSWIDTVLRVHAATLRSSLAQIARPRLGKGEALNVMNTKSTEEAELMLKQPGVLLEHGEWRAFHASLVRLQTAMESLKGSLLNRLDSLDSTWSYLSQVARLTFMGQDHPLPLSDDEIDESPAAKSVVDLDDIDDDRLKPRGDSVAPKKKKKKKKTT